MLDGLLNHYASVILIVAALALVLSRILAASRRARRRERPDPEAIFGPIRGMYVCYQCDTVFNTAYCPGCHEEAVVPLINLTGSILESENVVAIVSRIKARTNWKLAAVPSEQAIQAAPASLPKPANGDASEAPVRLMYEPERGRELS